MRKIFYFIVAGFILFEALNAHASDYLTLENAIKQTIERNPAVKAQDQDVLIKDMDKRSQFGQMLPTADLTYGYQRINEIQELPISMDLPSPSGGTIPISQSIPLNYKNNYKMALDVKQVLFAGGALYNKYLISKNDKLAAEIDRDQFIRGLKLNVIDAYYGVIKARQTREVAKSNVSTVKSHLDVANAFFNQGMIPKNDLLEAQVKYAESEELLITADNAVKIAEASLNILLQRNLMEDVKIDSEIPVVKEDISFDKSLSTAMENRQEIKTAKLQLDNASKGMNLARSTFMPSVAATYTYERTGENASTKDYDTWMAGVGMTWNLFSGGSNYWDYDKTKYLNAKAIFLIEALKNQVTLEVKSSFNNIEEAKARLQVTEKAIAQAEELARIQKDRYNLQVATTTDVLDAQTLLLRAKNNYITARADLARALAALKASMGTL